jgi:hypothetical protein
VNSCCFHKHHTQKLEEAANKRRREKKKQKKEKKQEQELKARLDKANDAEAQRKQELPPLPSIHVQWVKRDSLLLLAQAQQNESLIDYQVSPCTLSACLPVCLTCGLYSLIRKPRYF